MNKISFFFLFPSETFPAVSKNPKYGGFQKICALKKTKQMDIDQIQRAATMNSGK